VSHDKAAAAYVSEKYSMQQSEQQITFDPGRVQRKGKYVVINSPAYFSGASSTDGYVEDLVFVLCMEKSGGEWHIVYDLSRSDVPDNEEVEDIRKTFPQHFPRELLSDFWQELLK